MRSGRLLPAVAAVVVLFVAACDKAPTPFSPIAVVSVTLTGNTTFSHKGETSQLRALAKFSDGSESDVTATAQWTIGDPSIASVSASGLVTALAPGKCRVGAESQGTKGERDVEVQDPSSSMNSMTIQGDPTFSSPGQTRQLQSFGTFGDGSSRDMTDQTTWTTSNANVATVSDHGLVTSRGPGSCDITAAARSLIAKVKSTVGSPSPTPINLRIEGNLSLGGPGKSSQLKATATMSDGSDVDVTASALWSTDKSTVATISADGLLKAGLPGTCDVLSTFANLKAHAEAHVLLPVIESLSITGAVNLLVGQTSQLKAIAHMSDGTDVDVTGSTVWKSSDLLVALAANGGLTTGIGLGKCDILAINGDVTAKASINVKVF